jgi:FkbM family methyltransferase
LNASPRTIVDVGAAFGTPNLYKAFPQAYRVLVEPLAEYETALGQHTSGGKGEYHLVAVAAEPGMATINVDIDNLTKSSFHKRTALTATATVSVSRTVPVTTLDALYADRKWSAPILLKVDSEGCEDLVIQGGDDLLRNTELAIIEVSVSERFEGGYKFSNLVEQMNAAGFDFIDVLHAPRTRTGQLVHIDCAFRRRNEKAEAWNELQ